MVHDATDQIRQARSESASIPQHITVLYGANDGSSFPPLRPPSVNSHYHAAFIDFSACSLTISAYNGHRDDYGAVQEILVDPDEGVGLRKELIRNWCGKRENWDYFLTDHTKE